MRQTTCSVVKLGTPETMRVANPSLRSWSSIEYGNGFPPLLVIGPGRRKGKVNGGDLAHSRDFWPRKRFEPLKGFCWGPRGEEKANLSLQALDMEAVVSGRIEQDSKSPQQSGIGDYLPGPLHSLICKRDANQAYVRIRKRKCVSSTDIFQMTVARIAKGISTLILLLVSVQEHSESVRKFLDIQITSLTSCSLLSRPSLSVLLEATHPLKSLENGIWRAGYWV